MKLNLILLLVAAVLTLNCTADEGYYPSNQITIRACAYQNGENLPVMCDDFTLTIDQMANDQPLNDQLKKCLFKGSVKEGKFTFFPDSGRYIISARRDTLVDVVELIYNNGSLSLTLILQ